MLGKTRGKRICSYVPDYVLYDLETTGISCMYDKVIEISAIRVRDIIYIAYVDTLMLAKMAFPEWKHRRLGDLAEHYGIPTEGAHRALADCRMNQQVFELLAKELQRSRTPGRKPNVKICSACGMPMKKRTGRYGEFWGCTGYPVCRHTENVF